MSIFPDTRKITARLQTPANPCELLMFKTPRELILVHAMPLQSQSNDILLKQ